MQAMSVEWTQSALFRTAGLPRKNVAGVCAFRLFDDAAAGSLSLNTSGKLDVSC